MLKIEHMLMLKTKQPFANLTRIDWLGSPYAGIMLEYCNSVKLSEDKGSDDAQRQLKKSSNRGSKRRHKKKASRKAGRKQR